MKKEVEAVRMLQELIRIPSVTGSRGEEEACAFLEEILDAHGIAHERLARVPERPNLLAWIEASGDAQEAREAPLVLISHIDVVEAEAEKWSQPPFSGAEAEGRIWGRGTLDTKHLTVMELLAFLHMKENQAALNRDVWFLATIDEEGGSTYGMEYVKQVRPELFQDAVVINEGGGFPLRINGRNYMMLTVGEKGVCRVRMQAEGMGGHASAPGEDQAILKLAQGLQRIFAAEKELTCGSYQTYEAMERITASSKWDNPVGADIFGYASQNSIGMRNYTIGERNNVIPARAEAILEFKLLPGAKETDVTAFLEKQLADLPVAYEVEAFEPGFESDFREPAYQKLAADLNRACARWGFDGELLPMLALGRTDGRFFGPEGSRVYGCSPLLMEDSFDVVLPKVHGNDESISKESYLFGCRVLDEVLMQTCLVPAEENKRGE